jgi:hypothetical protein
MDTTTDALDWKSADGTVMAKFATPEPGVCNLFNFVSHEQHAGHGRRALQELREMFTCIRALCVGDEAFWLAMAHEGLVDELYDFYGLQIWPAASTSAAAKTPRGSMPTGRQCESSVNRSTTAAQAEVAAMR